MAFVASNFSRMWDTEVRALAEACVTEPRMIKIANSGREPTAEEQEYLDSLHYHDPYGMYYISDMIWHVEHALADGRDASAKMSIVNVYQVINGDGYCERVFKGDSECEEYQRIHKLSEALGKLLRQ